MKATHLTTIIVDADALIALFNRDDVLAARSLELLERLTADGVRLVHPATTIAEAVTTLQRRFSNPQATAELVHVVHTSKLTVEPVDAEVLAEALVLFDPQGSKQNTLFDAIVAAVAKRLHAAAIFSFDEWYAKQGFTLVSELYRQQAA
jgi:predicted nucleic acid-binding protein